MKKSIFVFYFLMISIVTAEENIKSFSPGEPIKADEMNANFNFIDSELSKVEEGINNLEEVVSDLNDLEVEIESAKTQLNVLQSVVNNNVSNDDDSDEIVGLTDPYIFGRLGLSAGNSVCPDKYPGSNICSFDQLEKIDDWSLLTDQSQSPVFLVSYNKSGTSEGIVKPCTQFNSLKDEKTALGYVSNGRVFIHQKVLYGPYDGENCATAIKGSAAQWVSGITSSASVGGSSDSTLCSETNKSYNAGSDGVYFSVCAINIPAACCK